MKVNPAGVVPAWKEDDGTCFGESNSILRYLANKHEAHEWWPEDLIERQRVDAGLDFCGTTVRPGLLKAIIVLGPKFFGRPEASEEEKAEVLKAQTETIEKIEKWLEGKSYIGGEKFSIADL